MNTWAAVTAGNLQKIPAGQWALYRAHFTPWRAIATQGGELSLASLSGRAEIWLDGVKVAEKTNPAPGPVVIAFPPKEGRRVLTLVVQSADDQAGLADAVQITARVTP